MAEQNGKMTKEIEVELAEMGIGEQTEMLENDDATTTGGLPAATPANLSGSDGDTGSSDSDAEGGLTDIPFTPFFGVHPHPAMMGPWAMMGGYGHPGMTPYGGYHGHMMPPPMLWSMRPGHPMGMMGPRGLGHHHGCKKHKQIKRLKHHLSSHKHNARKRSHKEDSDSQKEQDAAPDAEMDSTEIGDAQEKQTDHREKEGAESNKLPPNLPPWLSHMIQMRHNMGKAAEKHGGCCKQRGHHGHQREKLRNTMVGPAFANWTSETSSPYAMFMGPRGRHRFKKMHKRQMKKLKKEKHHHKQHIHGKDTEHQTDTNEICVEAEN